MIDSQNDTKIANESWVESLFLDGLNKAMNKTLSFDLVSVKKLEAFEGKVINVILDSTPFEFFINIKNNSIELSKSSDKEVNTTIKGTPLSLFAMNAEEPIQGIKSVEIHGDASTGQFFAKWMKNINPDWEEAWCQLLGDGMGVRASKMAGGMIEFGKRFKDSLLRNTKEYLVEESRDLIAQAEMEEFLDDVDDLKSDTARLEQHINQLKAQI